MKTEFYTCFADSIPVSSVELRWPSVIMCSPVLKWIKYISQYYFYHGVGIYATIFTNIPGFWWNGHIWLLCNILQILALAEYRQRSILVTYFSDFLSDISDINKRPNWHFLEYLSLVSVKTRTDKILLIGYRLWSNISYRLNLRYMPHLKIGGSSEIRILIRFGLSYPIR